MTSNETVVEAMRRAYGSRPLPRLLTVSWRGEEYVVVHDASCPLSHTCDGLCYCWPTAGYERIA